MLRAQLHFSAKQPEKILSDTYNGMKQDSQTGKNWKHKETALGSDAGAGKRMC
ncbi:hypothetical protein ACFOFO_25575 [Undibacterium arcticum]|uniref:Uncharacterized protein n=1 Tax=Undibacterium arcticum TaxID=1762892 RepID=A0ABV7F893_9BURK